MTLSAKRPSKGDETRKRLMKEVTGATEKTKRLNAPVEESLYKRIKARALEDEKSIAEITRKLWIEYLSK